MSVSISAEDQEAIDAAKKAANEAIEMTSSPNFIPSIDGIYANFLIELDGVRGPFYVGGAGGIPELESGFFYGDDKHQFCFYVDRSPNANDDQLLDIVIFRATTERLGRGLHLKVEQDDVDYLEKNIRKLFETRAISNLQRKLDHPIFEIRFTWRITK
jgi:hypothetical protein